jgi:hypothetical protein
MRRHRSGWLRRRLYANYRHLLSDQSSYCPVSARRWFGAGGAYGCCPLGSTSDGPGSPGSGRTLTSASAASRQKIDSLAAVIIAGLLRACAIYFDQVSSTTATALRHLRIGILYRIEYAKNLVNILGNCLRVWDIPMADDQQWRRNYAVLLWRAMALHSKNLANLETARGLFVTICSLTLDSEKARMMAR